MQNFKIAIFSLLLFACAAPPLPSEPFTFHVVDGSYPAQVMRVVDGDTFDVVVTLGWETLVQTRIRVMDIDTPEVTGKESALGFLARDFTKDFLSKCNNMVVLKNRGKEKYGRWLADVTCWGSGANLVTALKAAGHVKK